MRTWLLDVEPEAVVSDIARTELLRAVRRTAPDRMPRARAVLDALVLIACTPIIFETARTMSEIVNGRLRNRLPVAWWMALAIAAAVPTMPSSPCGRGTRIAFVQRCTRTSANSAPNANMARFFVTGPATPNPPLQVVRSAWVLRAWVLRACEGTT